MKKASLILFFKIFGAFSNLILGLLISRNFGESAYAEFSITLTLVSLGLIFCNWGGSNFIIQEAEESRYPYFNQVLFINLILSTFYILLMIIVKDFFHIENFFLYLFSVFFYTFFLTKSSILILKNRQVFNSFIDDFLKNILLVFCFSLFLFFDNLNLNDFFVIYFILMFFSAFYIFYDLYKNYLFPNKKMDWSIFFKNGLYTSSILIIILLLSQIDRFVINYYLSSFELARYFLCYSLMVVSSFFSQSLISLYLPKIIKYIKNGENYLLESISRAYSKIILIVTLLQIVFLNLTLPFIFNIYKVEFTLDSYILINILLLGNIISCLFGIGMTVASYTEDKKILAKKQMLVFCIHVPLLILCIPYIGVISAAFIYSLSQVLIKYLMYRFYIQKNIDFFIYKF